MGCAEEVCRWTCERVLNTGKFIQDTQIVQIIQIVGEYLPNATVQQSLLLSPSAGSMQATGLSFCLGSQIFTAPKSRWVLTRKQTYFCYFYGQFLAQAYHLNHN